MSWCRALWDGSGTSYLPMRGRQNPRSRMSKVKVRVDQERALGQPFCVSCNNDGFITIWVTQHYYPRSKVKAWVGQQDRVRTVIFCFAVVMVNSILWMDFMTGCHRSKVKAWVDQQDRIRTVITCFVIMMDSIQWLDQVTLFLATFILDKYHNSVHVSDAYDRF